MKPILEEVGFRVLEDIEIPEPGGRLFVAERTRQQVNARDFILDLPDMPPEPPPPTLEEERAEHIEKARQSIKAGRVLFYPACGFHWGLIEGFSDVCQTFIYCDWHMSIEEFHESLHEGYPRLKTFCCRVDDPIELEPHHLVDGPVLASPSLLRPEELERYNNNYEHFANKKPWARLVPLTQEVDGRERKVTLIYLCAEGVAKYLQLFAAQGVAPKWLSILNCGDGFGFNYTAFYHWGEPLGRAVLKGLQAHGVAPDFVITDRTPPDYDWPWNVPLPQLGYGVYVRPEHPMAKAQGGASQPAPVTRYFLDKHGAKTFRARGQPGEGHVDIGQEVLAELGVTPKDKPDVYEQMFQRKFVRVVEHDDHTLEVEYKSGPHCSDHETQKLS